MAGYGAAQATDWSRLGGARAADRSLRRASWSKRVPPHLRHRLVLGGSSVKSKGMKHLGGSEVGEHARQPTAVPVGQPLRRISVPHHHVLGLCAPEAGRSGRAGRSKARLPRPRFGRGGGQGRCSAALRCAAGAAAASPRRCARPRAQARRGTCAGTWVKRRNRASAFVQLALGRLLSAPGRASGCPKFRPASADQPLGPRWPAMLGLHAQARVVKRQDEAGEDARRAALGTCDAEALKQLHHRHVRLLAEDLHHLQFAAARVGVARNHLDRHARAPAVRRAPPRLEDGAEGA
eukprot:scaffold47912_cov73-Phaeocystis_antarctica.AAC.2